MAAIKSINLEDEVSQTLDLEALTGVDISIDPTLVKEIGQAVIDYMQTRVEEGRGYGGQKLTPSYSDEYAKSWPFKAAGKSKNRVNMALSGDMMGSIDIVKENGAEIKIAVESDQAPKAFNHQTGDTLPKRKFFGITVDEFKSEILPQFKTAIKNVKDTSGDLQNLAIDQILGTPNNLLRDILNPIRASDLFDGEN
jgi:hypothetical protein